MNMTILGIVVYLEGGKYTVQTLGITSTRLVSWIITEDFMYISKI